MKKKTVVTILSVVFLLFYSDAFLSLLLRAANGLLYIDEGINTEDTTPIKWINSINNIIMLISIVSSLFFFAHKKKHRDMIPFIVIISMIVLPSFLSVKPEQAFFNVVKIIPIVTAAFFLSYINTSILLKSINIYSVIVVFSCYIFIFIIPEYGISQGVHIGKWRGIFQHKNILGYVALFIFSYNTAMAFTSSVNRTKTVIFLIISSFILILGSQSKTSLSLAILVFILIYFFIKLIKISKQSKKKILVFIYLGLIVIYLSSYYVLMNIDQSVELDLTGRYSLWTEALNQIVVDARLVYGYGFNIFWSIYVPEYASRKFTWIAAHSHNSYIELLLDGGILLLITLLFFISRVAISLFLKSNQIIGFILFILLLTMSLLSFTETIFIENRNIWTLLLFLIIFKYQKT